MTVSVLKVSHEIKVQGAHFCFFGESLQNSHDEWTRYLYMLPKTVFVTSGDWSPLEVTRVSLVCIISLTSLLTLTHSENPLALALFRLKFCLLFTVKIIRKALSESHRGYPTTWALSLVSGNAT